MDVRDPRTGRWVGLGRRGSRCPVEPGDNRCWWLLAAAGIAWFVGDSEHVHQHRRRTRRVRLRWAGRRCSWRGSCSPTRPGGGSRTADVWSSRRLPVCSRRARCLACSCTSRRTSPATVPGTGSSRSPTDARGDWSEDVFAWTFSAAIVLVLVVDGWTWWASSRTSPTHARARAVRQPVLAAAVVYQYVIGWNAAIPCGERRARPPGRAVGLCRTRRPRSAWGCYGSARPARGRRPGGRARR